MELFSSNVNSLAKVGKRQAFKKRQFEKTAKLIIDNDKKEEDKLREEKAAVREVDKELDMMKRKLREAEAENERLDRELVEQERRRPPSPPKRVFPVIPGPLSILSHVTPGPLNILSPIQPRAPSEDGGRQGQRAPVWMGNFTRGKLF